MPDIKIDNIGPVPGRTALHIVMVRPRPGQAYAEAASFRVYECLDCGWRTRDVDLMALHQDQAWRHTWWQRLLRWWRTLAL